MTPLAFAWRSLTREPLRAILGIAGIAAVGALLFDMLLLSQGLLVSFRGVLDRTGFDVRVSSTDAFPALRPPIEGTRALVAALGALPEIAEVVPLRFGRGEAIRPDGSTVPLYLIGGVPRARGAWTILRGTDLDGPTGGATQEATHEATRSLLPILINANLAADLRLSPGSRLRVRGWLDADRSVLPVSEFRVVGIASFPFEASSERTAATTIEGLDVAQGGEDADEADLLLVASKPGEGAEGAVAAIQRARPDLHAFSNEQLVARFGRTEFSYFHQISFVLSTISLFSAFLLIATLLTVSVNQRIGEVAALRAIGFSRGRVAADLLAESALLVGTGGVLALPLGVGLSRVLDRILRTIPGIPDQFHFFVFSPRAVLVHAALLTALTLLAASYPIAIAARLPIAATLRRETVS